MADEPHEIWLTANGLRFRGLEWSGRSPTVLLLHATSFCADVWKPLWIAARAAGAGALHAVAVDQRGHGSSGAPVDPAAYAWPALAADALALGEAAAGRQRRFEAGEASDAPVVLAGHSSGATAALAAAGRAPGRVVGLVLVEPVLFDVPPPGAPLDSFAGSRTLAARAQRRRARFTSRQEARTQLGARFPYSRFPPDVLEAFLDGGLAAGAAGAVALRCRPEHESATYSGAARLDVWPGVARVRAPTLLVLGEHSAVPAELATRLDATLPDLQTVRVAGATHFAALERPVEVGRAIGAYLERLPAAAAQHKP